MNADVLEILEMIHDIKTGKGVYIPGHIQPSNGFERLEIAIRNRFQAPPAASEEKGGAH